MNSFFFPIYDVLLRAWKNSGKYRILLHHKTIKTCMFQQIFLC